MSPPVRYFGARGRRGADPGQRCGARAEHRHRHRALFSKLVRRGAFELPARSSWRALFGTIVLDLRQARLDQPEVELQIYNLFGTVTVLVPPGVAVEVTGGGAFASQVLEPASFLPPPGAPRLRIGVSGPGGTLYVRAPEPAGELNR